MEENKEKKCCEHGSCEGCKDRNDCCCCHHCHRHCGRGHLLRIILYIVAFGIIINLICSLFGLNDWFRGRDYYRDRNYMMDYRYGPALDTNTGNTVPPPATDNTTTPPAKK